MSVYSYPLFMLHIKRERIEIEHDTPEEYAHEIQNSVLQLR
jgi:hypothetical protein